MLCAILCVDQHVDSFYLCVCSVCVSGAVPCARFGLVQMGAWKLWIWSQNNHSVLPFWQCRSTLYISGFALSRCQPCCCLPFLPQKAA